MSLLNQKLIDSQTSINRAVWASNLDTKQLNKMKEFGDNVIFNEKSALEYMRYNAEEAIKELTAFLNETI